MSKTVLIIAIIFLMFSAASCGTLKNSKKSFNTNENSKYIDSMMNNALDKGFFPGAQIVVGSKDSIYLLKNYGFQDSRKKSKVTTSDVYDVASMSKVLGATLVAMSLVGEKKLQLKEQLGDVVSAYKNTPIGDITLFELLTHTTGLKPSILFYQSLLSTPDGSPLLSSQPSEEYPTKFDTMYVHKDIVYNAKYLSFEPKDNYVQIYKNMWLNPEFYQEMYGQIPMAKTNIRGNYLYSDLNLILVQQMIEAKTGMKLDKLANSNFNKLGISNIGYNPLNWTAIEHVIPTEIDNFFRKDTIRGFVHDETAAILGGVSGNAGLFANAESISVICQMLLNKGYYRGEQILKPRVVKKFTKSPLAKKGIYRGIGFDKRKPNAYYKKNDFGHTGFTGTFFFLNPVTDRFLIILTNRVNPSRTNRLMYEDDFSSKIWKQINN